MNGQPPFRAPIFFWVMLFAVSWSYNYPDILSKGPSSIHQWRQADCLSITQNYYEEDRPFLTPAIHWVGDADGRTVSECPLIYYSVAKLWRWFGKEYWMFRLVNIALVFLGLWALFRLTYRVTGKSFWAVFVPSFVFTSPILAYYTNNFMADAPALGLALTGGYLAYLGVVERKQWAYYLTFLVFLLAGLLKISSLILFIGLGMIHVLYALQESRKESQLPFTRWLSFIPYLLVVFILALWYRYAHEYNEANLTRIFLLELFPMWELSREEIHSIWGSLRNELLPAFFIRQGLWLVFLLFLGLLVRYKKVRRYWLILALLIFGGSVAYILLFYQAFTVHDYYLTNLLVFIPVVFLAVLDTVRRNFPGALDLRWVRWLAGAVLILLVYKTALINRMKYSPDDPWLNYNYVVSDSKIEFWQWFHYDYDLHMKAYESITPYLRSLGIEREDRILSFSDQSINISLYLMDQKGFSSFGYQALSLDDRMKRYKENGVRYIILDENSDDLETLKPYLGVKIGEYENLGVYDFGL